MFGSVRKSVGGRDRRAGSGAGGLSFIGAEVVVSGDVAAKGQIHIDGRVDGNVQCDTLIQGGGGTIAGHIVADAAHLAGLVDGTVKARLVTLEATARVTGDVTYETLSIAAGAAIEGRLTRRDAAVAPPVSTPEAAPPVAERKPDLKPDPAPAPAAPDKPRIAKAAKSQPKPDEPGLLAAATAPAAAAAAG
jgi:cytoskeletal protein CcmA (bactofilin family)